MSKKQDKAFIQEVKNWVKSNVWKGSGRIKIDAKTGEVTLPSNTDIRITCPVMNGITFNSFEPWTIYMEKATESDIIAVCKNIDKKHEYYLKLRYAELSKFPKELDGMSGAIEIDVLKNNIDFNDVKLNLCKLHIDGWKSSWIYNEISQRFEYHDGWRNLRHNYDAIPERLYKDESTYFIKNYKIFEIPSSFKPFIEKVMGK